MMKKLATTLLLTLAIIVSVAVTRAQTAKPTLPNPGDGKTVFLSAGEIARSGSFENQLYRNKLLGFSITLPSGWDLISDEVNKAGMDAAKEKVTANKSREYEQAMDKSISNTRVLFQAYSYNPSIGVMGCGVENTARGLTIGAYTEFNKNLVLSTNPGSRLKKDIYQRTVAGTVFNVFDVEVGSGAQKRGQTYFVTIRKNVMFFFVFTFSDAASKTLMENSLGTLTLDK